MGTIATPAQTPAGRHGRRRADARSAPAPGAGGGDIRVGPLLPIPALLSEYGLEPLRVLAEARVTPRLFAHPENRVPVADAGRLLDICAARTGCPHFGLLIGDRFTLDALGLLGALMRNSPTLRDALRFAIRYLELQDRAAIALTLDLGPSDVALGYSLFDTGTTAVDQFLDGTVAILARILRELCGPAWRPLAVQLSHRRPHRIGPFKKILGPVVDFDAPFSAVVFDARWLDRPIAGADPAVFAAILEQVRSLEAGLRTPFADDVRRAIHALVFTGSASTASLAKLYGMNERTLRRRLADEGTTVRDLVNEMRGAIARHLLRETGLSVSEIAGVLRYAGVTSFCRAFRASSGRSPRSWREQFATRR